MAKQVLITGGTGFLGQWLVRDFLAAGYRVGVLCRATSDRSGLADCAVEYFEAELTDAQAVLRAVQAAAERMDHPALIHNAALISYRRQDRARLQAANVQGVQNILQACEAAGLRRLLHVSSVVGVGISPGGREIDEAFAFNARRFPVDYVQTKRRGEELALAAPAHLEVTVVNPGAIFGPVQVGSNSARFLQGMAAGKLGRIAPPGGMAVVGVWDCARGVRLALERGSAGQRYILAESYVNSRQLFDVVGRAILGRDPVRWRMPKPLWSGLRFALSAVSLLREPAFTTPQAVRMLGVEFNQSGAKARRELGWDPIPFEAVIAQTVQTMRAQGLLPASGIQRSS